MPASSTGHGSCVHLQVYHSWGRQLSHGATASLNLNCSHCAHHCLLCALQVVVQVLVALRRGYAAPVQVRAMELSLAMLYCARLLAQQQQHKQACGSGKSGGLVSDDALRHAASRVSVNPVDLTDLLASIVDAGCCRLTCSYIACLLWCMLA